LPCAVQYCLELRQRAWRSNQICKSMALKTFPSPVGRNREIREDSSCWQTHSTWEAHVLCNNGGETSNEKLRACRKSCRQKRKHRFALYPAMACCIGSCLADSVIADKLVAFREPLKGVGVGCTGLGMAIHGYPKYSH